MTRNMLQRLQEPSAGMPETTIEGELVLPTDTRRPMRIGLSVLGLGFGGFLLWAALAPLDEGVPTQGTVAIDTKRKSVQHPNGGIVREVFVKEGQYVKAGEPLVRLDDASTLANYESVRQHYLSLRATEGRLLAEQANTPKIAFHADVLQATNDPYIKQTVDNQEQLFRTRRAALQADLAAIREAIEGQEASIRGYEGMLKARKAQETLIEEDLKGMRDLVKEGYAPRNKQLELERMAAESMGSIAELHGTIQRARATIAEMKMRAGQRQQEYRKEVDTQLAEVRREVQADAEKYRAVSQELERTLIRSPAEGQVVGLGVQTVGAVIGAGQKLMDIVPENETLMLETRVPPHLIDRVRAGQLTDVRFSGFAHTPQLVVEGKIISVSGDLLSDPGVPNAVPYYLARLTITPEGMRQLGKHALQPGMPVEVIVRTGERSLLTYLLHPLTKRLAASMKEE